jgi:putative N6-adenine-specific DNA methylase
VYLCLFSGPAPDFDALFAAVRGIRWADWFKKDVRVLVDKVRLHKSALTSERAVQGMAHKAIYDSLGAAWGMRSLPETGEAATVRVYIEQNELMVMLDLSGMPLHRRGYRTAGGEAPIRETLAACLLQLSLWRRKTPLHDPFAGSGTIPIEATLYAHNIAPGLGRSFALESLTPFMVSEGRRFIEAERASAAMDIRTDCLVRVTGSDIDPAILISARGNAERACSIAGKALLTIGRKDIVPRPDFTDASFEDLAPPYPQGLLLANPPYGERLGDAESASSLYRSMATLRTSFEGWDMGFITSHAGFERDFGAMASKRKSLKAGNLETVFYHYRKGE